MGADSGTERWFGVLRLAPNFFCIAAMNALALGESSVVRYDAVMKVPSASLPMLLAVPSPTLRLPMWALRPASLYCLVSVTLGAPPAVDMITASGLAARILLMTAVHSVASIGWYSS